MVSTTAFKIHGSAGVAAAIAVLLLSTLLLPFPSHASMYEADAHYKYKHVAPAPSPMAMPVYTPEPAPAPAPTVIIVRGVIYCKSCKLANYNSGMDASPLPNATAKLVCEEMGGSGRRALEMTSTATDGNGFFLFMVYDVAAFTRNSGSCKVYLRSSPTTLCDEPFLPGDASIGMSLAKEVEDAAEHDIYSIQSGALMYKPRAGVSCPAY